MNMNIHIFNIGECGKCGSMLTTYFTSSQYPFDFTDDPGSCDILLVTGCMLKTQHDALLDFWKQMPKNHKVVKIGNCSTEEECIFNLKEVSGLENQAIDKKDVAELIPIDEYIKGCPPELDDLKKSFENTI